MNIFDERAKQWDRPDRAAMASSIALCMLTGLRLNSEMTAIDFGAGTGLITLEIAKRVKHITALDSSAGMIEVMMEKINHGGVKNISTMLYDIEKSSVLIEPADVIVSSMTMHHVRDIERLAVMLYSMLKPGGQLAAADLEKEDGGFHNEGNSAGVMHKGFDRGILAGVFKRAGFIDIRFTTAYTVKKENGQYPVFLMLAKRGE